MPEPVDAKREAEVQAVERLRAARASLKREIHKVIVGQDAIVDEILIALFCRGHALVVGVPGLAKTLIVSTIARALELSFSRIQFTPDLMPSDITGTDVLEPAEAGKERRFRFIQGPVFANVILADEINRTPPKTQAALLEAMQERQVTAGGRKYPLPAPFFVLATQNPIEQEGTYPLPEAQLDRFMFNLYIGYPSREEEKEIVRTTTYDIEVPIEPVLGAKEVLALQSLVRKVPAAEHVVDYAVSLVRASRPGEEGAPDFVQHNLSWGAGPRATQYLVLGAKARAVLDGRYAAEARDVRAVALPVLRHRLFTNFTADSEGVTAPEIVRQLLAHVKEKGPEAYR